MPYIDHRGDTRGVAAVRTLLTALLVIQAVGERRWSSRRTVGSAISQLLSKLRRRLDCGVRVTAQAAAFQQGYVCPRRQTLPGPCCWLTPPDGADKPSPHPVHEPGTPVPGNRMARLPSPLLKDIGNIHHKSLGT